MNNDLWTYFDQRPEKVHFVRRRPYKKNDNAHVEQKNWTHVRQLLGYDRLDTQWDVDYINDLYVNYWLPLWNYFTPVMKLKSKTRIGGRIVKVHDEPQTPCERVLNSEHLSKDQKQALLARREHLNPFGLRNELEKKLKWYFRIVDIRKKISGGRILTTCSSVAFSYGSIRKYPWGEEWDLRPKRFGPVKAGITWGRNEGSLNEPQ